MEENEGQEPEAPVPMDRLAKIYLKIRTKIQEKTAEYDTEMEALKAARDEVALAMKEQMQAAGVKSARTDAGTVILGQTTRYYGQDWDALKTFILENECVDLLEKRIAQKNMAEYLEANPDKHPPGINSVSEFTISVRKATK